MISDIVLNLPRKCSKVSKLNKYETKVNVDKKVYVYLIFVCSIFNHTFTVLFFEQTEFANSILYSLYTNWSLWEICK